MLVRVALSLCALALPLSVSAEVVWSQEFDGGGDQTRFYDPLNWDSDTVPGDFDSFGVNDGSNVLAAIDAVRVQVPRFRCTSTDRSRPGWRAHQSLMWICSPWGSTRWLPTNSLRSSRRGFATSAES